MMQNLLFLAITFSVIVSVYYLYCVNYTYQIHTIYDIDFFGYQLNIYMKKFTNEIDDQLCFNNMCLNIHSNLECLYVFIFKSVILTLFLFLVWTVVELIWNIGEIIWVVGKLFWHTVQRC
jgi:hypothetical protein